MDFSKIKHIRFLKARVQLYYTILSMVYLDHTSLYFTTMYIIYYTLLHCIYFSILYMLHIFSFIFSISSYFFHIISFLYHCMEWKCGLLDGCLFLMNDSKYSQNQSNNCWCNSLVQLWLFQEISQKIKHTCIMYWCIFDYI